MSSAHPQRDPAVINQPPQEPESNGFVEWLKGNWFALLLIILSGVFIAQNTAEVTINLLWTSVHAPLWVAFLFLLVIGVIAGLIMARRRAKRKEAAEAPRKKRKR